MHRIYHQSTFRKGAATVELALVLPFLLIMFVGSVDFARVYYYTQIVADCARNGAFYASHPDVSDASPYEDVQKAALAGASNLSPPPSVDLKMTNDASGKPMAEVTVRYQFNLLLPLQLSSQLNLSHTARMRVYPSGEDDAP